MVEGRIVKARTAAEIEEIAELARENLGLDPHDRVSMTPLLEQVLYDLIPGFDFRVEDDRDMGSMEGLTDCDQPTIRLKWSTYAALQRGDCRARMTAAHEFGHLLMHCQMPAAHAFSTYYNPLHDPERQANVFAAAFLMPRAAFVKCRTAREAQRMFGASRDAVTCRARKLRHRFQKDRPILTVSTVAKKKGSRKRQTP